MLFCKKCGLELDSEASFCSSCGTPVSKTGNTQSHPDMNQTAGPTLVRPNSSYGVVNQENLPDGFIIDDRYEIKEKLGQGGFGAVYRANDRNLGVDKALKIIPNAVGSDFEAMINLRAETKALINLNHPSIVRVYDFHESGNIKYIDMELIEGKSLSQIKAEAPEHRLQEKQVMEYAIQIAEGMAHAHAKGIIHRDIKPQNVIITNDNHAKILDFGIAQTLHTSMSRLTNTSSSGTLVYMSPEQINGQDVGKESDIYSFGSMLYELLSGKPPFWQGAIEHQILNVQPKPLEGVSQHVNSLVMNCLEKDYQKRKLTFEEIKLRKTEEEPVKAITNIIGEDNKQPVKKEPLQNQISNNNNNNDWKKPVIAICVVVIVALAGIIISLINKKSGENNNTVKTSSTIVTTSGSNSWIVTENTLTDPDGNTYTTVTIGNQVWTVENLKTTKYNDGTSISYVPNSKDWENLFSTPGYCWYNNKKSNKATYGALYNWHVVNTGKLAPSGWHVPTDDDWTTLSNYLGGEGMAGDKMKETGTSHWKSTNTDATNSSGFSALPGGYRNYNGSFLSQGIYGYWWSATGRDASFAWSRSLNCNYGDLDRSDDNSERCGFSVRLVRD